MCNSNNSLFLNIDLLRFMPPCRVNRDENNRQKTIMINGGERLRISSQCIKAGLRNLFGFNDCVDKEELVTKIKDYKDGDPNESFYLSEDVFNEICGIYTKEKIDKGSSNVVVYVSLKELKDISSLPKESRTKKENGGLSLLKKENILLTDDVSLFGRMYAIDSTFKVESASQVAHAFSIQDVEITNDNWVCRNSLSDVTHCTTMNYQGIGSALMYFNANLNISDLIKKKYNKEKIISLVVKFVVGFYTLLLNSGVSGTASNTLPVYCHVTVGNKTAYNHSTCFYKPLDHGSSFEDAIELLKKAIDEDNKLEEGIRSVMTPNVKVEYSSKEFKPTIEEIKQLKDTLNKLIKSE